ncbi:hypothetical protein [Heyndrickxia sporothermodurans]|uniref:hypothetical protein n=1 Tax=Heyndrickxia sporothermodurans TaxID=46224 RepID=UPI000D336635|nr:hypothetical protein [Heyndrickxia sporothermodurans]PTY92912.1 hypothetical protein B5V90_02200 [Heyndrickxia sporothermodurans]
MNTNFTIESQTVLEGLSKKVLRNKGGNVVSVSVHKKFAALETMMIPGSGLTELLHVTKDAVVKAGGNTSKTVDRFFGDIMYVSFVGNGKNSGSHRSNIVFQGAFVKHDGRHTSVLVNHNEDSYFDLLNHKPVAKADINIDEYIEMTVIGATPSMLRKKQILMGNKELPWVQIINKLSYGALKMQEGFDGNMAKLNKLFARMFHMWAPHKYFGTADTFAFYNGEFADSKGNAAWDGMMFVDSRSAAKWMANVLGVAKIEDKAVIGMGMQMRPDTNKAFGSVVSGKFIEQLMNDGKPVYRFTRDQLTPELEKSIWTDAQYKNAWIIVGEGYPEYVSDRNCLKAEFDLAKGGRMVVLAMAKYSPAHTSIQMLSKVAANAPKEVFINLVKGLFAKDMEQKLVNLKEKQASVVPVRDAQSGYILGIVDKIAPKYVAEKDQQLFRSVLETLAQSGMKASNRLKFRIDGASLSLMADIGELVGGERVLNYGEFYAPYANRYFKQHKDIKAKLGTIIKYPSVGTGEFYQATAVSFSEIRKRVNKLNVDKEVKALIINWYASLSDGLLVMPTVELLKKQLAGLDFDFDGATIVLDEEFNSVMSTINPLIVDIDPGKTPESNKKYALEFGNFHHVLRAFINSPNKSVGEITVMNDTVIALLNTPFEEAKRRILEMLEVEEEGSETFVPLMKDTVELDGVKVDRVSISPEATEEFVANLRNTKITEENIRQILLDIVAIFRYYQEVTIDSVKTGVTVDVAFEMNFVTKSVTEITHKFEDGQMNIFANPVSEYVDYIDDVINSARVSCAKGVRNRINALLGVMPEYDAADLAMFEAAVQGREDLEEGLVEMKKLYNDLTGSYIALINEFEKKRLETDGIRQEHKRRIAAVANMIRRLTADLTAVDRGLITKSVSMSSKGGTRADGGSRFATIIAPEYVHMISKKWGETGLAGAEIIGKYEDGDVVEFVEGQAEKAISTNEAINGTFTIKEIDGKLYATKPITEVLEVPEADNSKLVFKLHWSVRGEELENAATNLQALTKVKLTANPKDRDTVRDLEGNVIARISCEGRALSSLYNGVVGEVEEVNVAEFYDTKGRIMKSAIVTLRNIGDATPITEEPLEMEAQEVADGDVF